MNRSGPEITQFAWIPVTDYPGNPADPLDSIVGWLMGEASSGLRLEATNCAIAITSAEEQARIIEIPPMPLKAMGEVVRSELDRYGVLPVGSSAYDWMLLADSNPSPSGGADAA